MADLQPNAPASRAGKPRRKPHTFRLDMTPMVDLAFLLLTFFMLTTTFSKSNVMQLTMPEANAKETSAVTPEKALTLILGRNSQVHYFFGLNSAEHPAELHTTTFGADGLRQILLARQRQQPAPTVLIKAGPDAKYRDLVDALDEMNITDQGKYALVNLSPADRQLLVQHGTR